MHGYDAAQINEIHVFLHSSLLNLDAPGRNNRDRNDRIERSRKRSARIYSTIYLSRTSSLVLAATAMTSAMSLSSIFNSLSVAWR